MNPFRNGENNIILIGNETIIDSVTMVSGYDEATVSLLSKSIRIASPTNQGAKVVGSTTNSFDLTDYTSAYIVLKQTTSSSYGNIKVGFSTGQNDTYVASLTFGNGEGNSGTHDHGGMIDISSLTGNHYLCFSIPKHGYSSSANIYLVILGK